MNTKLMKNMGIKKKKKGFTLIELIIVIAILAILAALALPKFGAVKNTANISADKATAKNIQTTISKLIAEDKLTDIKSVASTEVDPTVTTGDVGVINKNIDGDLTAKVKEHAGEHFSYAISDDGNITVSCDGDEVFPKPTNAYAAN